MLLGSFFSFLILFNTENVEKKVLNALDQLKFDWFDGSKAVVGGSMYLLTYVKKLILKIYTFNFSLHWSNLFLLFNSSAAKDFFAKVRKTCLQLPLSQSKNRFRNIFLVVVFKGSFFSTTRNKKKSSISDPSNRKKWFENDLIEYHFSLTSFTIKFEERNWQLSLIFPK